MAKSGPAFGQWRNTPIFSTSLSGAATVTGGQIDSNIASIADILKADPAVRRIIDVLGEGKLSIMELTSLLPPDPSSDLADILWQAAKEGQLVIEKSQDGDIYVKKS